MSTTPRIPVNEFLLRIRAELPPEASGIGDADLLKEVFKRRPDLAPRITKATQSGQVRGAPSWPETIRGEVKRLGGEFAGGLGLAIKALPSIVGSMAPGLAPGGDPRSWLQQTPVMRAGEQMAESFTEAETIPEGIGASLLGSEIASQAKEDPAGAIMRAIAPVVAGGAILRGAKSPTGQFLGRKIGLVPLERTKALVKLDAALGEEPKISVLTPQERAAGKRPVAESPRMERAVPEIAGAETAIKADITKNGLPDFVASADEALARTSKRVNEYLGPAMQEPAVATTQVTNNALSALSKAYSELPTESALINAVIKKVQGGQALTIGEAHEVSRLLRAQVNWMKQAKASPPRMQMFRQARQQLRGEMDKFIDSHVIDSQFKELMRTWGDLSEVVGNARDAFAFQASRSAKGLLARMSPFEVYHMARTATGSAMHGLITAVREVSPRSYQVANSEIRSAWRSFKGETSRFTSPRFTLPPADAGEVPGPGALPPATTPALGPGQTPTASPSAVPPSPQVSPPVTPTAPSAPTAPPSARPTAQAAAAQPPIAAAAPPAAPVVAKAAAPVATTPFQETLAQRFFTKPFGELTTKQRARLKQLVPTEADFQKAVAQFFGDPTSVEFKAAVGKGGRPSGALKIAEEIIIDYLNKKPVAEDFTPILEKFKGEIGARLTPAEKQMIRVTETKPVTVGGGAIAAAEAQAAEAGTRTAAPILETKTPEAIASRSELLRKTVEAVDEIKGTKRETPLTEPEVQQRFAEIADEFESGTLGVNEVEAVRKFIFGKGTRQMLITAFGLEGARQVLSFFKPTAKDKKMEVFE